MMRALGYIQLGLLLGYPWVVHVSLLQGDLSLALLYLPLLFLMPAFSSARALLFFILLVLMVSVSVMQQSHLLLYAIPVVIMSAVLYLFARTLLPGRTPLVSQMHQLVYQDESLDAMRYTRFITWLWTLFLTALIIESLLLAAWAPLATWSLFTNFINYLLMLALLLLEWITRPLLFPGRFPLMQMLRKFPQLRYLVIRRE